MDKFLLLLLSLSLSGGVVTLLTAGMNRLLANRVPRGFLYYLWLAAVVRFLCPFGAEWSLTNRLLTYDFQKTTAPEYVTSVSPVQSERPAELDPVLLFPLPEEDLPTVLAPQEVNIPAPAAPKQRTMEIPLPTLLTAIWGLGALGALGWHLSGYLLLCRRLRQGEQTVSPAENALFQELTGENPSQVLLRRSVGTQTPVLVGLLRPAVYLPAGALEGPELGYALRHELVHWRRHDLLYKWVLMGAACLHWFNPAVWLLVRMAEQDCELSCDQAAVQSFSLDERAGYGKMLLRAAARQVPGSSGFFIPLWSQKQNLKERLNGIMKPILNTKQAKYLTAMAAVLVLLVSAVLGSYALQWGGGRKPALSALTAQGWQVEDSIFDTDTGIATASRDGCRAVLLTRDGGASWEELTLPQPKYNSIGELVPDDDLDPNDTPFFVLGNLPEEDITLYGLYLGKQGNLCGALLRSGEHLDLFLYNQNDAQTGLEVRTSAAPNIIPSQMVLADYDGDGKKELAVSNLWSRGTACYVEELSMFETAEEGGFTLGAVLREEDITAYVEQAVSSVFDPGSCCYSIQTPSASYQCDLSQDAQWFTGPMGSLSAGEIIRYILPAEQPFLAVRGSLLPESTVYCVAEYVFSIQYDGQAFLFAPDLRLEAVEGYPLTTLSGEDIVLGSENRRVLVYATEADAFTQLLWPFEDTSEIVLSSLFGSRKDPITGRTYNHTGIDIPLPQGTPVLASAEGTVTESDFDETLGNYVVVEHGTLSSVYGQLKERTVEAGETVSAGQPIGTVGRSGKATGYHLHFEVRESGTRTDPLNYLPVRRQAPAETIGSVDSKEPCTVHINTRKEGGKELIQSITFSGPAGESTITDVVGELIAQRWHRDHTWVEIQYAGHTWGNFLLFDVEQNRMIYQESLWPSDVQNYFQSRGQGMDFETDNATECMDLLQVEKDGTLLLRYTFHTDQENPHTGIFTYDPSSQAMSSLREDQGELSVPLTEQELAWFNESFFNGDRFNFHNQFLTCLYDRPEDIDLFNLFYNGVAQHTVSQEELALLTGTEWYGVHPTKITAAEMEDAFWKNTGLVLDQTLKKGLEQMDFLPEYDAYYIFHGDTNYEGAAFHFGETVNGFVRLYYYSDSRFLFDSTMQNGGEFATGWFCLTLRQVGDSFQFVSHRLMDTAPQMA